MDPSHKKLLALGLIAGGVALAYRARQKTAPVNGLGWGGSFVSSITNSVQHITDNKTLRPVLAVTTFGMSEATRAAANLAANPKKQQFMLRNQLNKITPDHGQFGKLLAAKSPLLRRFSGGRAQGAQTAPAPGQEVVYTDAQGNTISYAEYNAIMNVSNRVQPPLQGPSKDLYVDAAGQQFTSSEYALWLRSGGTAAIPADASYGMTPPGAYRVSDPYSAAPGSSAIQNPAASSGGGGGGGQSYSDAASAFGPGTSTAPAADASAQSTATGPNDEPAPAPKKFHPLVILGALVAVPIAMGLGRK